MAGAIPMIAAAEARATTVMVRSVNILRMRRRTARQVTRSAALSEIFPDKAYADTIRQITRLTTGYLLKFP